MIYIMTAILHFKTVCRHQQATVLRLKRPVNLKVLKCQAMERTCVLVLSLQILRRCRVQRPDRTLTPGLPLTNVVWSSGLFIHAVLVPCTGWQY
jgi:hypothetical protein